MMISPLAPHPITRFLSHTGVLALVLLLAYVLAFTNGFRMPNLWSVNYFLPSMFEGFYRRSLLGTLLFPLGDWRFNYYTIASIQIAVFITLNFALVYQSLKAQGPARWLWPLFLLCPAGGYFFHEIGYVDQVLYLILLLAMRIQSSTKASVLMILSLFIHEMALFTTLPVYWAWCVYQGKSMRSIVKQAGLALIVFGLIYLFLQTSSIATLTQFLEQATRLSNYPVRSDYYEVFKLSFVGGIYQVPYTGREIINHLLLTPLWIMSGWCFSQAGKSTLEKRQLFAVGTTASFAPILLGIFGWDYSRWLFLSMASSAMCLFTARTYLSWRVLLLLAILLLSLPTVGFLDYFDRFTQRFAPWYQWPYFYEVDLWKILKNIPSR
jgi:hypothetical protein